MAFGPSREAAKREPARAIVFRGLTDNSSNEGTVMANVMLTKDGNVPLPPAVREKHGFTAETPIRIVETRGGVLLVPLTDAPMSEELAQELAEWQALSLSTWEMFPFEDAPS